MLHSLPISLLSPSSLSPSLPLSPSPHSHPPSLHPSSLPLSPRRATREFLPAAGGVAMALLCLLPPDLLQSTSADVCPQPTGGMSRIPLPGPSCTTAFCGLLRVFIYMCIEWAGCCLISFESVYCSSNPLSSNTALCECLMQHWGGGISVPPSPPGTLSRSLRGHFCAPLTPWNSLPFPEGAFLCPPHPLGLSPVP